MTRVIDSIPMINTFRGKSHLWQWCTGVKMKLNPPIRPRHYHGPNAGTRAYPLVPGISVPVSLRCSRAVSIDMERGMSLVDLWLPELVDLFLPELVAGAVRCLLYRKGWVPAAHLPPCQAGSSLTPN